ncbi:MAG: hypothetical protein AAB221_01080 [Bacteroidota bacterium]
MKKLVLIALFFLFFSNLYAKYRQVCTAQYMTQEGWSKKYQIEVTFMTGYELNNATNTYKYSMYSVYAIIFWAQGQASVIKLTNFFVCGLETNKNCITSVIGNLKGSDQDGDEWKICKDDFCF